MKKGLTKMHLLIHLMWITLTFFKSTLGNSNACEENDLDYSITPKLSTKYCDVSSIVCKNVTITIDSPLAKNSNCLANNCYYLTVTNSSLSKVDSKFLSSMCNRVLAIYLYNCEIDVITEDAFSNFPIMEGLLLARNKIKTLEFLDSAKSITFLSLEYNELIKLNADSFRYLQNLEILNVAHNKLVSLGDTAYKLHDLQELYLNNNKLVAIAKDVFRELKSLIILNLADNNIELILPGIFDNLKELRELFLQNNYIKTISPSSFNVFSKLDTLDISNNVFLSEISEETYSSLHNLRSLNLSHNNFSTIIALNSFLELSGLERLNLTHNKLFALSRNSLDGSKNLTQLVITKNRIEDIPLFALGGASGLWGSEPRNNCLCRFNMNSISNLSALRYLDLSYNNIKIIDQNMVHLHDELQSLELNHNTLPFLNDSHYHSTSNNDCNCEFLRNILNTFELQKLNYLRIIAKNVDKSKVDDIDVSEERTSSENFSMSGATEVYSNVYDKFYSEVSPEPKKTIPKSIQNFDDNGMAELVKLALDVATTVNALFYLMFLVFIEILCLSGYIIYRQCRAICKIKQIYEL